MRFLRYKIETDSGLMQFTIVNSNAPRLQLEKVKQGIGQGGRGGGGGEAVKSNLVVDCKFVPLQVLPLQNW